MALTKRLEAEYKSGSNVSLWRKRKAMEQATRMEDGRAVRKLTSFGFVLQRNDQLQPEESSLTPIANGLVRIEKAHIEIITKLTQR